MKPRHIDLECTVNDDFVITFDNVTQNSTDYGAGSTAYLTMKRVKDPTQVNTLVGVVDPEDANKWAWTLPKASNNYQGEYHYQVQITDGVTSRRFTHVVGSLRAYAEPATEAEIII